MYEIRFYRFVGNVKIRTAKIKKSGSWFGFFGWCRLWFTLRKMKRDNIEGVGIPNF
jgi:hypothetical protein